MAGNREGVGLYVGLLFLVMYEVKRWFNNLLFAPAYTDFIRLKFFSKRLFMVAENKNNVSVVQSTKLFAKCRKLIEHLLRTSGSSMKEIACDQ